MGLKQSCFNVFGCNYSNLIEIEKTQSLQEQKVWKYSFSINKWIEININKENNMIFKNISIATLNQCHCAHFQEERFNQQIKELKNLGDLDVICLQEGFFFMFLIIIYQ